MDANLTIFLERIVERAGPKPALLYGPGEPGVRWTYTDLWERASRVACWLQAQGIAKGDRIIIWGPNTPWWVACYFGALRCGAILVPLDVRSGPDFVGQIVAQTTPKLAFVSQATRSDWHGEAPAWPMEDLVDGLPAGGVPQAVPVDPEDIATVVYTSGTTGLPKGVVLTHGNILFDVWSSNQCVPNTPAYRTVSLLPLSHMFEQTGGLLVALQREAAIYYLRSISPATIFTALTEHGATALLLVPRALHMFMATIEREVEKQGKQRTFARMLWLAQWLPIPLRRRLFRPLHERLGGKLEFLISASAAVRPDLLRKWELLGIPVVQAYGATECVAAVSVTRISDHDPYSVGIPIRDVEIKIADDGEILVRGANVFQGYWQNPAATAEVLVDGWYHTGDLGRFDERKHLHFLGRKKDMIALPNGQKVYAIDVESALKDVPGVVDAAVVGLPVEEGQQVHAALILDAEAPRPDALIKQANAHLARHQYVLSYTVWPDPEFPSTFTMKVKKHEVLARVLELRRAAQAEPAAAGASR